MGKLRYFVALWAAKLSIPALKITRHNGTNFPGELAIKICPDFLKYIGKPEKIVAVTGTNGKTTTCNMTVDILEKAGYKVLNNRAGSNINSGIATSLITGCNLFGKTKYKLAVFEVDERSSLKIYPYVKPDYILITNLFRDSIMRNGHPQYIADFITKAVPKSSKLILNADDLIACNVAPNNERVYFGIRQMDTDRTECINLINDMQICPVCQGKLKYDYLRYHHIGKARCPDCGFSSPAYTYAGDNIDIHNMTMTVSDPKDSCEYKLVSDNIVNIYHMVSVIAILRELGMNVPETAFCRVYINDEYFDNFYLNIPGEHNVMNALSVIACGEYFSIDKKVIEKTFKEFTGAKRRFELRGKVNGITVVEDYAHHPTELKVTINACLNYPHNKLWVVFQPHTYSRTKLLFDGFVDAMKDADEVVMNDIYSDREENLWNIYSEDITNEVTNRYGVKASVISKFSDIVDYIAKNAKPGDFVLVAGSQSINKVAFDLVDKLNEMYE